MSWEVISCWIEGHPGLASWVQAVGSIAAILVAVRIASGQHRKQLKAERERDLRVYEMIKVLAKRATRAVDVANATNEFLVDHSVVQISGLRKTFENFDTLSLPYVELVEPISTIRDALHNLDIDLQQAKRSKRLLEYTGSEVCALWVSLVRAASKQIHEASI